MQRKQLFAGGQALCEGVDVHAPELRVGVDCGALVDPTLGDAPRVHGDDMEQLVCRAAECGVIAGDAQRVRGVECRAARLAPDEVAHAIAIGDHEERCVGILGQREIGEDVRSGGGGVGLEAVNGFFSEHAPLDVEDESGNLTTLPLEPSSVLE
jgi:hypothetical protein